MDIYSLVQKLPEDLVKVIASYDPTKELKRKQLKKSFDGIHRVSRYMLSIGNRNRLVRPNLTIWEVFASISQLVCAGADVFEDMKLYHYNLNLNHYTRPLNPHQMPRPLNLDGETLIYYAGLLNGLIGGFEGNLDVLNFGDSFYGRHQGNLDKLVVIKELDETNKDLVKDIRQRNLLKYLLAKWNKLKQKPQRNRRNRSFCRRRRRRNIVDV